VNALTQVMLVIFVVSMATITALALGRIVGKRDYKEGYNKGFQEGQRLELREVYKKRLIRQSQRATAKEKQNEPAIQETGELDLGLKKERE
jgi:hypothetical protein